MVLAQLGAGGDAIAHHEEVEALLAILLVNGGDEHTAGIDAHHLARGQVDDGNGGLADKILGLIIVVDAGENDAVGAGAVVEHELQKLLALGHGGALLDLDRAVLKAFEGIDFAHEMPIVTGYVKCDQGIMKTFDRGYSEITFSKIAVLTHAREGVIHKEFHLSTGDPKLIGEDKVQVIGNTNFDIADQLSDMGMEAIHPKAAKEMEIQNIPIRVKNAFDPEHPGTLISRDYVSPVPRVEMICGRNDIDAIEVHDPRMVGEPGYDHELTACLKNNHISYIAKTTNANTITHFVSERAKTLDACLEEIRAKFPDSKVEIFKLGIISVIGTNMRVPGFLTRAAKALYDSKINVLALDQTMRQVNIQFMVNRLDFKNAQIVLHREFVEKQ